MIKTGSPMREVLAELVTRIDKRAVLDRLQLTPNNFFLVSCHREENVDSLTSSLDLSRRSAGLAISTPYRSSSVPILGLGSVCFHLGLSPTYRTSCGPNRSGTSTTWPCNSLRGAF